MSPYFSRSVSLHIFHTHFPTLGVLLTVFSPPLPLLIESIYVANALDHLSFQIFPAACQPFAPNGPMDAGCSLCILDALLLRLRYQDLGLFSAWVSYLL